MASCLSTPATLKVVLAVEHTAAVRLVRAEAATVAHAGAESPLDRAPRAPTAPQPPDAPSPIRADRGSAPLPAQRQPAGIVAHPEVHAAAAAGRDRDLHTSLRRQGDRFQQ